MGKIETMLTAAESGDLGRVIQEQATRNRIRLVAVLLFVLCGSLIGCSGEEGASGDPLAGPGLSSKGQSTDLVCPLLGIEPGGALAEQQDCCAPGSDDCGYVGGTDRRRAVLLDDTESVETQVSVAAPVDRLRFSLRLLESADAESKGETESDLTLAESVDVTVAVGGAESTHAIESSGAWSDIEVDLSGSNSTLLDVRFTRAAGHGRVAVGMPRLVSFADATDSADQQANVMLYLIDTLRPDRMSIYGHDRSTTPYIDEFFEGGWVFTNAYSTASWTRPGTASLLSSLYPSFHGANIGGMVQGASTIAEHFRAAGFSTWAFVSNANVFAEGLGYEQGFDRFVSIAGARGGNHARTEEINAFLIPHLEQFPDEPFFVYVHTVDPHEPYDPPPPFLGQFTDANYTGPVVPKQAKRRVLREMELTDEDRTYVSDLYDEDILYQDAMFGVLDDALVRLGLRDNLVTVLTSDHGEELFEHGDVGHGQRLWEEAIRIPLLIAPPRNAASNTRQLEENVQIVDVMPTLLDWFRVAPTDRCQGLSLLPLMRPDIRQADDRFEGREIYCEEPRTRFALYSLNADNKKVILRRDYPKDQGGRATDKPIIQYFDLLTDPLEQQDLSTTLETESRAMVREVAAWNERFLASNFVVPEQSDEPVLDEATVRQLKALGYLGDG